MTDQAPLILIPGLWLNASTWQHVTPTLERSGHRCHALTLPGMASKAADRTGITATDHIAAVVEAIDAARSTDRQRPLLVAHSAGCAIAHAALDARPEAVAGVIHVGGFPVADGDSLLSGLPVVRHEVPMPDWIERGEQANIADLTETQLAALYAEAIPVPERVVTDPVPLRDPRRHDVPLTLVCPEYTAEDVAAWIAAGDLPEVARASYELIDLGGGHWPQISQPDALAEVVLRAARG